MKKLALICLFAGLVPSLHAQAPTPTPRPVPPPGPLLNKADEMAQWVITSKTSTRATPTPAPSASGSPAAAASAPPAATADPSQKLVLSPVDQTTTVIKTKTLRSELTVGFGGAKIQKWYVPDMQVTVHGAGVPVVTLRGAARNNNFVDYSAIDFVGFEWISPKNYTGIMKVSGQDCLVFKDKVKADPDSPRGPRVPATACISADSRLPVALQLGEEVRTYQFGPPPTEMLVLPPDVATLVEKWRKTLHQAALPPGKP